MSILRRISLSLGAKADGRELPRGTSFNDLSMGAASWGDGERVPGGPSRRGAGPMATAVFPGGRAHGYRLLCMFHNLTDGESPQERPQGFSPPASVSVPASPRLPVHTSPFGSSAPGSEQA